VARVTITGPNEVVPVFRVPGSGNDRDTADDPDPADLALVVPDQGKPAVRTMGGAVGPKGVEPSLAGT
jgi:hypothetical protein